MAKNLHQDVIAGSVIALLCAFLYPQTHDFAAGAALWPRLILGLLFLLAMWIVFRGIQKTRRMRQGETTGEYEGEEERLNLQLVKSPLGTLMIVIFYVALLVAIGFFPATIVFLAGYLWYGGVRSWKVYALTIVGLNFFIYFLFVVQLNVRLPSGFLLQ